MKTIDRFTPPVSPELLKNNNFFDFYPFDGGGCFINRDIVGSHTDSAITAAIMANNALADYGTLPELNFAKYERWQTVEKSCWINRMYFVPAVAHHYQRTGDETLAKTLLAVIRHFKKNYPAPASLEEARKLDDEMNYERDHGYNAHSADYDNDIRYQWYDFQVGSRIVNLLYAMYFMKDSPSISAANWRELDEFVFSHAQVIYWIESDENRIMPGNHQALRGAALMMACSYFKDDPRSKKWIPVAEKVCEYHIMNDFLPDGMIRDLSPSYQFFETWISRDAVIIADREGYKISREAHLRLNKAFDICRALRQPDGLSTVISDGYPLELDRFNSSLPAAGNIPGEFKMADAGIAIYSSPDKFLLFDCSPLLNRVSHYHGGKQAITLFVHGKPFITEAGCCNYDDPDFCQYCKLPQAHSSMLIDDQGDSVLQGRYTWLAAPKCLLSDWHNGTVCSEMSSDAPGWKDIVWKRDISIGGSAIKLHDTINAPREVKITLAFLLHPDVEIEMNRDRAVLKNGDVHLQVKFPAAAAVSDGMCVTDFIKRPTKRLLIDAYSSRGVLDTVFSF